MTREGATRRDKSRQPPPAPRGREAGAVRSTRLLAGTVLLHLVVAVAGCGTDDSTRPASIELLFQLQTIGINPDTDGYTLTLNGGTPIPLPTNGETSIPNTPVTNQEYEIGGLAANCRLVTHSPTGILQFSRDDSTYQIVVLCLQQDPGSLLYTSAGVQLRRRNAYGGSLEILPFEASSVAATPDGSRMAFGQYQDIWTANIDGSGDGNVTNTIGILEERPDWSPDGSRIVFERSDPGGTGETDIYVMDTDGSNAVNLTPGTDASSEAEPAWSRDGSRIVFQSDRSEAPGLYTIAPGGGDLTRLTEGPVDVNPRWSPDGGHIAFGRYLDPDAGGTNFELFTIGADGSGLTQLTDNGDYSTTDADWSPDGRWMVIASRPLSGSGLYDLYSMSPDGRDIVRLTLLEGAGLPRWIP